MSNIIEYDDIMAFHPGYYVADIIDDMGISQSEFAKRLGTDPETVRDLVNGDISVSDDLAKKLAVLLGTGSEIWINLQASFDKDIAEIYTLRQQKYRRKEGNYHV